MIKASELRVGNLITRHSTDYTESIIAHDIVDIAQENIANTYLSDRKPINIAEEWLLKWGFEKSEHDGTPWFTNDIIDVELTLPTCSVWTNATIICKHIQYVHQLQNLYFALTGEELQLK